MRFFNFLPLLLISPIALAVDCFNLSTPVCDNLYINSPINLTGASGAAIEIVVSGEVVINANIILDGENGVNLTADNTPGVSGGPGASNGGGLSLGDGEPGGGFTPSDGSPGINNSTCNPGGGGGGGITLPGANGSKCNPTDIEGAGGLASGFPSPFSGGFGAGAGGAFQVSPLVYDLGGGGGGGGGLHIQAAGTIKIKNGVRISARGGRGGNATNLGGAGGGGSGGVIWLEATGGITNAGIFDVRGGAGGVNTKSSTPRGGNGGKGGDGIFRLDSAGTITDGTGRGDFSSSSKLTSDISCATVAAKPDERNYLILQMMLGFVFVIFTSLISKMFKRCRINFGH